MPPQKKLEVEVQERAASPLTPQTKRGEVASLAYSRWEQRGCPEGSPEDVDVRLHAGRKHP